MANPTHNVCDRPVPSVINSESWLIARIFRDLATFAVVAGAAIWGKATAKPGLRGLSMSDLHRVISGNQFRRDPSTQSRTAERTLNSVIVHSEISRSDEEYLEIFDEFYTDDIEGSSETMKEPLRGKERVRSLLSSFLASLHANGRGQWCVDIRSGNAGSWRRYRRNPLCVDTGMSGKICTVSWRILRKWNQSRVVLEHHYDYPRRVSLLQTATWFRYA